MGRPHRTQAGGLVNHVLNRANRRAELFAKHEDYEAWLGVLAEAQTEHPMRLLFCCVMPNHWHLVLWPEHDGTLSRFVGWLTLRHTQRWHAHRHSVGSGHLHQGRFKSFVVQADEHLLTLGRYVDRNAARAATADGLDGLRQHAADGGPGGGFAALLASGQAVWRRGLGPASGAILWSGKHTTGSGSASAGCATGAALAFSG